MGRTIAEMSQSIDAIWARILQESTQGLSGIQFEADVEDGDCVYLDHGVNTWKRCIADDVHYPGRDVFHGVANILVDADNFVRIYGFETSDNFKIYEDDLDELRETFITGEYVYISRRALGAYTQTANDSPVGVAVGPDKLLLASELDNASGAVRALITEALEQTLVTFDSSFLEDSKTYLTLKERLDAILSSILKNKADLEANGVLIAANTSAISSINSDLEDVDDALIQHESDIATNELNITSVTNEVVAARGASLSLNGRFTNVDAAIAANTQLLSDAAGTQATLDARISVSLNDDGTPKTIISASTYSTETNPIVRIDGDTFTVTGNLAGVYVPNRTVRINDTVVNHVLNSSYSSGTGLTTVNLYLTNIPASLSKVEYSFNPNELPLYNHSDLMNIAAIDPTDTDTVRIKHLSNNDAKTWTDGIATNVSNIASNLAAIQSNDAELASIFATQTPSGTNVQFLGSVIINVNNKFLQGRNTSAALVDLIGIDNSDMIKIGSDVYLTSTGFLRIGSTVVAGAKVTIADGNIGIYNHNDAQQFYGGAGNVAGTNTTGGVITVFGHSPNPYGDVSTPPHDGTNFVGAAGIIARGFSESAEYRGSLEIYTKTASSSNASRRILITHDGKVSFGSHDPQAVIHTYIPGINVANIIEADPGQDTSLQLRHDPTNYMSLYMPASLNDMRVYSSNFGDVAVFTALGKFGIRTPTPQGHLDINTEVAEPTLVWINGEASQSKYLKIRDYSASEASLDTYYHYMSSKAANIFEFGYRATGAEVITMTFNSSNDVGIPNGNLNVSETISAASANITGNISAANIGAIAIFRDQKAQGTHAGGSTAGVWTARTLNATMYNEIPGATITGSNQFTLTAGKYRIKAKVPAMFTDHNARLQNITDTTTVDIGTSSSWEPGAGSSGNVSISFIDVITTIAATKVFEVQSMTGSTVATWGLGQATNLTTELYTVVTIEKLG